MKGELGGIIDNVGVYQNRDEYLAHAYKTTESMEQLVNVSDKRKLTIENSGVRITEEEIENIFEPFYRTEKSRNRYTGGSVNTPLSLLH